MHHDAFRWGTAVRTNFAIKRLQTIWSTNWAKLKDVNCCSLSRNIMYVWILAAKSYLVVPSSLIWSTWSLSKVVTIQALIVSAKPGRTSYNMWMSIPITILSHTHADPRPMVDLLPDKRPPTSEPSGVELLAWLSGHLQRENDEPVESWMRDTNNLCQIIEHESHLPLFRKFSVRHRSSPRRRLTTVWGLEIGDWSSQLFGGQCSMQRTYKFMWIAGSEQS